MTKFTTKTKLLALALTTCSVLALGTVAEAETVTSTASATVSNAITFAEGNALSFGEFVLVGDGAAGGDDATILVGIGADNTSTATDGGTDPDDDRIVEISKGTRGTYNISDAVASTPLTVTLPATPLTLTCTACTGGNPTLVADTWTSNAVADVITTTAGGVATLYVGATLTSDADATQAYEDGDYEGDYDVTVEY